MTTIVIGAGLAGLAASEKLAEVGADVTVVEQRSHWGGHASSYSRDGFVFDEGPHILFSPDSEVVNTLCRGLGEVDLHEAVISNYYKGHWIPHPVQCNLHALPADTALACIVDFLDAKPGLPCMNYRDWCYREFGTNISELFIFPYTRKYWATEPSALGLDWIGERVFRPSREQVIRGALGPWQNASHNYITRYRYPTTGGFGAFAGSLARSEIIHLDSRVVKVDTASRIVTLSSGEALAYTKLISTIPLPNLIGLLSDVPETVREAASRLVASSLALIDIALAKPTDVSAHWFYVYDEDLLVSRCSQPQLLSAGSVPEGRGAIQAEVYWSPTRPLAVGIDDLQELVIDELVLMGVLDRSDVLWAQLRVVDSANVVFDHLRQPSLDIVRPWVELEAEIVLAGRYGLWEYLWSDGAVRSGWRAAEVVLASGASRLGGDESADSDPSLSALAHGLAETA